MPMDDGIEVFKLESEQAAFDALRSLLRDRSKQRRVSLDLTKADWLQFRYVVTGDIFHQTITPSLMLGLVDFQRAFYRSAALILKGEADIRRLTDSEKDQLELVFVVGEGSADYLANAKDIAEKIASSAVDKMGGVAITICVIVALLLYFGHTGVEDFVKGNIDIKKAEVQAGREVAQSKALTDIISKDRDNMATLAAAVRSSTAAQDINDQSRDGYDSLVRHSGRADAVCVQGLSVSRSALDELTQISRRSAKDVSLTKKFVVKTIDRLDDNFFNIKLEDGAGGSVSAVISDPVLVEKYMRILQYSLAKTAMITVTLNGRMIGDDFASARISRASRKN